MNHETSQPSIDLNCDLGESFGRYTLGLDEEVLPLVSSANIACGMHAGDPVVMRKTVELAARAGVAIGAHPGYPDLQGFGRRDLALSPDEVYAYVVYQIGALAGMCAAFDVALHHVKPHGQLYNRAAKDEACARAIARAVHDVNPDLVLVGLAGSLLVKAGREEGLRAIGEFFTDRNYNDDGTLVARSDARALITDEDFAVRRVCHMVETHEITSVTGAPLTIDADTICVHGDNIHALQFVRKIRSALTERGIKICAQ